MLKGLYICEADGFWGLWCTYVGLIGDLDGCAIQMCTPTVYDHSYGDILAIVTKSRGPK